MNPTPQQILKARKDAGLTQRQAGDLLYKDTNTWAKWEQGINRMAQSDWELFNLKVKKL